MKFKFEQNQQKAKSNTLGEQWRWLFQEKKVYNVQKK